MKPILDSRKRGIALVATAAILGILSLLALGFAVLSGVEYQTASNYADKCQTRLLAQGALDCALVKIQQKMVGHGIIACEQIGPETVSQLGNKSWQYTADIKDISCLINVNQPYPPRMLLKNICQVCGIDTASAIADNIIKHRPPVKLDSDDYIKSGTGYVSIEHVKKAAQIDTKTFDKLKPF